MEYVINQVCVKLDKRWSECVDVESMQTVVEEIIDGDITNWTRPLSIADILELDYEIDKMLM